MSDIISKFNNGMNNTPRVKQQNAVPALTKTNLLAQYNSTTNSVDFKTADGTIFFSLDLTNGVVNASVIRQPLPSQDSSNPGLQVGHNGGPIGDKLGFYGTTPIIQPLLATGTGKTVDNVITVLQNLGLVRQS